MLKVDDIRDSYLQFFAKKGHPIIPSDSLVPQNDPSLLFTGAGMNQFKDNFLGVNKQLKRATSSQKCLRTGDLEEVGRTPFHHSFFEMLGNFSFGDYFKEEAIFWAWEYLTTVLKIPPHRLRISVHEKDEEAYSIWKDKIKIRPDWLYKLGDKGNFWPSNAPKDGPNGPCGPCSEIYYDQNPEMPSEDINGSRFAEIWNLVFTQYDRQDGGVLVPLAQKNIDTGMGLERLACVLQGKETNFEIDSLSPINAAIEASLKIQVPQNNRRGLYAITDHVRAVFFSIADGAIPSNEGRGYVIRKLIRRALWQARQLTTKQHLDAPFLHTILPVIANVMRKPYPELSESLVSVQATLKTEEERFLGTLDTGVKILESKLNQLKSKGVDVVPGDVAFELYDTYGFPEELTRFIAEKMSFKTDQKGFESLMDAQRKRAKEATQISANIFSTTDLEKKVSSLPDTVFLGYESLQGSAKILFVETNGEQGVMVTDKTPFYAESGGQIGDAGKFKTANALGVVVDTQKKDKCFIHSIIVTQGGLKDGDEVELIVDSARRSKIMRNHTATHLLHAALRDLLGAQVRQLGSLVSDEKLRFDYSYSQSLTQEQIKTLEDMVNAEIFKNISVTKEEKTLEDAKKDGAMAFFGEKYGASVRVVTVKGFSKELCGGTHCSATGQIGTFIITSESSVASGTRRIEALTGEACLEYIRSLRLQLSQVCQSLKTTPDKIAERVTKLQETVKKMEKDKIKTSSFDIQKHIDQAKVLGSVKLIIATEKDLTMDQLRSASDIVRSKSDDILYFLASEGDDKIQFLLGLTPQLGKTCLDMRELAKVLAKHFETSGGGRKDLVQGGAAQKGQLSDKSKVDKVIMEWLHPLLAQMKG